MWEESEKKNENENKIKKKNPKEKEKERCLKIEKTFIDQSSLHQDIVIIIKITTL